MIDANQITARLRMMSDAELQRFAEMHKQDPYVFPLAFNESNTRKQLRMQGQAQGHMQAPQPPVNQQALAAMRPARLPEDQGIGALNPEMQFADGGLIGFASGGSPAAATYGRTDDMQFNTGGVAYADGGVVRFQNLGRVPNVSTPYDYPEWMQGMASGEGGSQEERMRAQLAAERAGEAPTDAEMAEIAETRKALRGIYQPVRAAAGKVGSFIGDVATYPYRRVAADLDKYAELINAAAGKPVVPRAGTPGNRPELELLPSFKGSPTAAAPAAKPIAPPPVPTPQAKGPGIEQLMPPEVLAAARRGAGAPLGIPSGGAPRPTKTAADFSTTKDIEDFYAEKIKAEEEKASKRFEEYKKGRPGPETFAEEKALLAEDTAETEKQQRMNEGLAWLTFASTVAQPGKSALQAIVEGVSVGAGQYAKAQGDLKKAEKERKAGLAVIARMERAERRKDYDALESYNQQLQGNVDKMNAAAIDAVAKARNVDQQTAAAIYMNEKDNATRLQTTQISAGTQLELGKLAAASRFDVAGLRGKPIMTLEDFAKLPQNMALSNAQLVAEYNKMLAAASEPSKAAVMSGPPPENALKPKM